MLSVSLGPFALPVAPLLLAAAAAVASTMASRMARSSTKADTADRAGTAVFHALLLGLLAARLTYVAQHAEAYRATPLALLDMRDGGWHAGAGALAGAAWLAWRGRREPQLRRGLAAGALAGAVVWAAGLGLVSRMQPKVLPSVALQALDGGATLSLVQAARGRPLVVNLWASWCGPCRQEMPMLAQAQQRQPHIGFLFVNQGESAEAVRRYLDASALPLREVLLDSTAALGPGARQGSCRLIHAASGCLSCASDWAATTESRSGLSVTAPTGDQLRVAPDQRSGLRSRALRYSAWRAARMA
jgi:thiol-disulfide isomerase/thioredoxin